MRNQKNESGITLVALVVTIVVLLILAGITIMYVMGDNSVFDQASQAGKDTELGAVREAALLSINANVLPDMYLGKASDFKALFQKGLYNGMTPATDNEANSVVVTPATETASASLTITNFKVEMGEGTDIRVYTINYNNTDGLTVTGPTAKAGA